MKREELVSYKKNGFLILKGFFPKTIIGQILNDAKSVFLRLMIDKGIVPAKALSDLSEHEFNSGLYRLFETDINALANGGKQIQHLISLHRLSLDQKIEKLLHEAGLSYPVISTRPVMYFNHSKLAQQKVYYKVDAHQDWRSMQGSLNSVVLWVPLVDVNKELGALEVLPGSHLNGLQTDHIEAGFGMVKLEESDSQFLSVELEQGDALLFSSFLIHQSGDNITDSPRWSCHFRYNDLDESTFIKRNYAHPYIYKPQEELITKGFPSVSEIRSIFLE